MAITSTELKKQILASKISHVRSLNLEKALEYDLNSFFKSLKEKVIHELKEYWPDNDGVLLQGQLDLILAPIFESQQEYYNILREYNIKEYDSGYKQGRRLVNLARKPLSSFKSESNTIKVNKLANLKVDKDELFGTNDWTQQKLLDQSFTASENTMNRVDSDINKIISDGYKSGHGINKVAANIENRFQQLQTWESKRIARTEIHNAHQMGIMNIYQEMGVQYTQWTSAHDSRVRGHKPKDKANHIIMDGEIIPLGGTYSNGLQYPGDTKGPIHEWINCRCGNVPYIIPDGYIAPPGMAQFHEKDLIPTLDNWNQDELIELANQEVKSLPSEGEIIEELRKSDFDIYRLPPNEREYYHKLKKNHDILKEALETKNYNKLDQLDHSAATMIESKESVKELGEDFLELAKEELDDYALDISEYEKIIKDKNIKVTIEPKLLKGGWKNDALKDNYHCYNPETKQFEPFNTDEKFIKYHFKKENLTIYESADMDHSRVIHVYENYKKLPKKLQNTNEIVLSSQNPISKIDPTVTYGGYVKKGEGTRIIEFKKTLNETIDTIVHEATHNLEKDQLYYISNSKEYVLAFKKDQKRLLAQGKRLKETYVTEYSYGFTEAALESNSPANRAYGHRIYSEDLAESMKKYLRNKKSFAEDYPEKAKVLEKVLNDGFKPKTTTPYKKWWDIESERFKLTPKEVKRNQELKWKQTDLALNGKKLSSKELKELEFYEDKTTFDYLYNKKIDGELLDKSEEKAFNAIRKKWKKKLKIPNEILSEEIPLKEGKYFNKKDISEYKKLKSLEIEGKLKGFKNRKKLELLENQKEFDSLDKKLVKNGKLSHEDAIRYKKLNNNPKLKKKFNLSKIEDTLKLEGKTKKKNIFDDIPRREKSKWDKNVDEIKETKHSTINNKKYVNRTNESQEAIDEMVERQKLNAHNKELARTWSGDANISMNQYLNGEEIDLEYGEFSSVNKLKESTDELIDLIDNMPEEKCIQEDTLFFRGTRDDKVDLTMFIPDGKTRKLKTLTSTSYNVDTASDFAEYTDIDGSQGWILKIHAPKGTKGVALNDDISTAPGECEYLLSPNQKYITHNVDEENKIIEIELVS